MKGLKLLMLTAVLAVLLGFAHAGIVHIPNVQGFGFVEKMEFMCWVTYTFLAFYALVFVKILIMARKA